VYHPVLEGDYGMTPVSQAMTPFKMVFDRTIEDAPINMSGHFFTDTRTGAPLGWLVMTWTERGVLPILHSALHWVSKGDGKLRRAMLRDFLAVQPLDEDTKIEPERAAFIRENLENWEREYLAERVGA
jgi:hypothetical protein